MLTQKSDEQGIKYEGKVRSAFLISPLSLPQGVGGECRFQECAAGKKANPLYTMPCFATYHVLRRTMPCCGPVRGPARPATVGARSAASGRTAPEDGLRVTLPVT